MSTKKYKPEQIVTLLRQIEVQIANVGRLPPSVQGGGDPHLLPLAKGIRQAEARPVPQ